MDAVFVFQCPSAMPELLDDQRAVRSFHTYLNRIGQPEFAESLLGAPEITMKKRPRRKKFLDFLTPQSTSATKQDEPSHEEDQGFDFDLKTIELERIGPRLTRHLAGNDLSTFTADVIALLNSKKIEIRRKREIVFQAGCILLECNLNTLLSLGPMWLILLPMLAFYVVWPSNLSKSTVRKTPYLYWQLPLIKQVNVS